MVSSANLNKGGAVLGYNDLFTMVGVPSTFALYAAGPCRDGQGPGRR